jgi:hypothetical protein
MLGWRRAAGRSQCQPSSEGGRMPSTVLLDACGRRRSPATLASFHQSQPPRNKGHRYPADPPTVEEIIAVMHAAGEGNDAVRLRGLIVVLWRDIRRQAARGRYGPLGLGAADPMAAPAHHASARSAVLRAARPHRRTPVGARRGPLAASPCDRASGRATSVCAHQLRYAHAVEMSREGVPLRVICSPLSALRQPRRAAPCRHRTCPLKQDGDHECIVCDAKTSCVRWDENAASRFTKEEPV